MILEGLVEGTRCQLLERKKQDFHLMPKCSRSDPTLAGHLLVSNDTGAITTGNGFGTLYPIIRVIGKQTKTVVIVWAPI